MTKKAIVYRMEADLHVCPFGLKVKDLLKRQGFQVEDKLLTTREQVDNIKAELDVKTTPQVCIDDQKIGGYEEVRQFLGIPTSSNRSYFPVMALFIIAGLVAAALAHRSPLIFSVFDVVMLFIGLAMTMLGLLKLQDIHTFTNSFLGYDLLARRYVPYAYVYPFVEVLAGLLMIGSLLPSISMSIMLFIGVVGGISVIKAVYIDKRDIKCACVGGNTKVPLGFVSLLENLVMVMAAIAMALNMWLS